MLTVFKRDSTAPPTIITILKSCYSKGEHPKVKICKVEP